jgi:hypothetical protein
MLKQKLYNFKLSDIKLMEENLRSIHSILAQLAGIGAVVYDQELLDLILSAFPSSWNTFGQILSASQNILSFGSLKMVLFSENGVIHRKQQAPQSCKRR